MSEGQSGFRDGDFILLGMAHRAEVHGMATDIIQLSPALHLPVFPQCLSGFRCVIGVKPGALQGRGDIVCKLTFAHRDHPQYFAWQNTTISGVSVIGGEDMRPEEIEAQGRATADTSQFWSNSYDVLPLNAPPFRVYAPTFVSVTLEANGQSYSLGHLAIAHTEPPPLAAEERRALASRPNAVEAVIYDLSCSDCGDKATFHCLLDPANPRAIVRGEPIECAPDYWKCKCPDRSLALLYLKKGMHDLLRRSATQQVFDGSQAVGLYTKNSIADLCDLYCTLINGTPKEEEVQQFLEEHPLVWAFLSPSWIKSKPRILTQHAADFGILTEDKVLYLVEIEKPQTRLETRQGQFSHELERPNAQVRNWKIVVENQRSALLESLGLANDAVHSIRYLVVAGMACHTSPTTLRQLRTSSSASHIEYRCFDELAMFLHSLQAHL